MAEWSRRGLQILVRRFDSGPCLQNQVLSVLRLPPWGGADRICLLYAPALKSCLSRCTVFRGSSAVEQSAVNRSAAGSNPAPGAMTLSMIGHDVARKSAIFPEHVIRVDPAAMVCRRRVRQSNKVEGCEPGWVLCRSPLSSARRCASSRARRLEDRPQPGSATQRDRQTEVIEMGRWRLIRFGYLGRRFLFGG